jgi:hypothetical protein
LQGPGRALTLSKKYPEILQLIYGRSLIAGFPHLTTIQKIDMALTIKSCETDSNFSKPSVIKKFRSTMLVERLNYLSVLSVENDIIKSSYEEAIKEYAAKKCKKKKVFYYVCQPVN